MLLDAGQVPGSGESDGRLKARQRCANFVNFVKNRSPTVVGAGAEERPGVDREFGPPGIACSVTGERSRGAVFIIC